MSIEKSTAASAYPAAVLELRTEPEWREAAKVLQVLRPSLEMDEFAERREELIREGYRLIGVFSSDTLVSIASYTISPHAVLGRELLVHDMATRSGSEGKGFGTTLLRQLERIAMHERCGRIFVHTRRAQNFYSGNGFVNYSTGMIKNLF